MQIAQIVGKPDLAPAAWVKRLVTLCDRAPPTPFDVMKLVLESELGQGIDNVFERFDVEPLGSASIAQVRLKLMTCYLIFTSLYNWHHFEVWEYSFTFKIKCLFILQLIY